MCDENGISDEIRARYVRDDRIPHPAEVAVYERNGTVTLRGSVGSIPQIRGAVEIAKSVRGVRTVVNELTLDPLDHWEEGEIKGAALQALMPISEVPENHIDVKVASGWITLKGRSGTSTRATRPSRQSRNCLMSPASGTRSRSSRRAADRVGARRRDQPG